MPAMPEHRWPLLWVCSSTHGIHRRRCPFFARVCTAEAATARALSWQQQATACDAGIEAVAALTSQCVEKYGHRWLVMLIAFVVLESTPNE